MKKFNKIFPILILVILIIATFVLCSCDFSSTNNNRNNTNSNEQLNSDNKYSGTIGAQKPMSLTPNTAINSDMTALQMMNASISNYYAADYAANLCVKGGVDSNFGSIHVQQNVRTLKVREGKASDSSVRYFNYSKSFGLANMNEEYLMNADGSIVYRKGTNVKTKRSNDGKIRIYNDWEKTIKYQDVEVFQDCTSTNFTQIWDYVLNEETIKSECINIKPEYDKNGGYYTFIIEVDVSKKLAIADYKKVMEYQLSLNLGMKVENLTFTKLEFEFSVWDNGFLRYVDIHEAYNLDLNQVPILIAVHGVGVENNYMNEYSFDKNEKIPYDTCEQNERIEKLSFEDFPLLINKQEMAEISKEGDFVIYTDGELKELIRYVGTSTNITIPSSATRIGSRAFYGCSSLTTVTIPSSVTSIDSSAFSDCYKLVEVCNKSALTINKNNYGLYYIKNIYIEEGGSKLSKEGDFIIYTDGELKELISYEGTSTKIVIPNTVTSINEYAFRGYDNLISITIPDSVTNIGSSAFSGCSSLTSITIPSSVTSIGKLAFSECSSLKSIKFAENSQLTSIGDYAFYGCSNLTSITIPSSVTSIGEYAFYGCNNLQYNVYEGIKYLGNETNPYIYLAEVIDKTQTTYTIHNDTRLIRKEAFYGCSSLTSITIPSSVTSIGESAFDDCRSLTSIEIPSSVTNIGRYAFYGCSSLTNITIPSSVTSIGEYAFNGCSSLISIEIPSSVTSIGYYAFYGCSSLTNITIPSSVTSIGYYAFYGCSSLTNITIPSSVTSIGTDAFSGCSSLTIYCEATSEPSGWDSSWNYSDCPVYWYSETEPTESGNYWHYVNGEVTIWG